MPLSPAARKIFLPYAFMNNIHWGNSLNFHIISNVKIFMLRKLFHKLHILIYILIYLLKGIDLKRYVGWFFFETHLKLSLHPLNFFRTNVQCFALSWSFYRPLYYCHETFEPSLFIYLYSAVRFFHQILRLLVFSLTEIL